MMIKKLIALFILSFTLYGFGPTGLVGFGAHTNPVAGGGGAGLVFDDGFNHDNATDIVGTTPDTVGTSWLDLGLVASTNVDLFVTGVNFAQPVGDDLDDGLLFHANYGTVGSADVTIIADMKATDSSNDDSAWIIARYADANNFIGVEITRNVTTKCKLFKVVAGTDTEKGQTEFIVGNTDSIKLVLSGQNWTVFHDRGSGFVEEITITGETDLTAAGKTGMGFGTMHSSLSGRDIKGPDHAFDRFRVTED